jgi:hypothetical protein
MHGVWMTPMRLVGASSFVLELKVADDVFNAFQKS